ncbi:rCG29483 [Rattus norvegicus]|uniref:RCG29483 n=1 Tax=Rattus norvegicus TaxID=10116 RepID=A6K953_RAT|nr:rCG29483 [Rattus norvegicus]
MSFQVPTCSSLGWGGGLVGRQEDSRASVASQSC